MAADFVVFARQQREHATTKRVEARIDADVERIGRVAEWYREMTKLYQERLEGGKRAQ